MSACIVCGQSFEAGRSTRRYCSGRCRVRALRSLSVAAPLWPERDEAPGSPLPADPPDDAALAPSGQPGPAFAPQRWTDAALRAIAEGIATPVDDHGPARAYCEVREGGFGVAFGLDGGRRSESVGPAFDRPRDAIRLSEVLNDRIAVRAAA